MGPVQIQYVQYMTYLRVGDLNKQTTNIIPQIKPLVEQRCAINYSIAYFTLKEEDWPYL